MAVMNDDTIRTITKEVITRLSQPQRVPVQDASFLKIGVRNGCNETDVQVGVSVRHLHLCLEHIAILFGEGHVLQTHAELYQPGYFAAKEQLLVAGPKGAIAKVRVLGPPRAFSQVELAQTDALAVGLKLPIATDGSESSTQPITMIGPKGMVHLPGGKGGGAFIARRHVHLNEVEALTLGVKAGDLLDLRTDGLRPTTLHGIFVRIHKNWRAEVHIDTDEANGAFITNGQRCTLTVPKRS